MKRRFFLAAVVAFSAGAAGATGHESVSERVKSLGTKVQRPNTVLSNVNFIISNAKNMSQSDLVKAYAYLNAAEKIPGLPGSTVLRIQDAKTAVRDAYKKYGSVEELEKLAADALRKSEELRKMMEPSGTVGDRGAGMDKK